MGFASAGAPQRSGGGGGLMQSVTQARKCDGVEGRKQSHVVQKLQSICVHVSTVSSCCRQPAMQTGFEEQMSLRKRVNGCAVHSVWTRASSLSQVVAGISASHPRNCPPPQMQS